VNCGALPGTLVEAELFGAKKGAFSGAVADRPGLVRTADQGTLFLDEIGELGAPAQAALLRVIQEREVVPVGATRPMAVDFRLITATHRDLPAMVDAGTFRADLLARITGFVATLLPLRERREDLGLLIGALLARLAPGGSPAFSLEAMRHGPPWLAAQRSRARAGARGGGGARGRHHRAGSSPGSAACDRGHCHSARGGRRRR
jgi:transcriptional regulator with GAF, ATPase, and Fis domain